MAKPVKFPKKFRMKLEKMAADRKEREEAPKPRSDFDRLFGTLYKEVIPPKSVNLLYTQIDDERMTIHYRFAPRPRHYIEETSPPWAPIPEKPASS